MASDLRPLVSKQSDAQEDMCPSRSVRTDDVRVLLLTTRLHAPHDVMSARSIDHEDAHQGYFMFVVLCSLHFD